MFLQVADQPRHYFEPPLKIYTLQLLVLGGVYLLTATCGTRSLHLICLAVAEVTYRAQVLQCALVPLKHHMMLLLHPTTYRQPPMRKDP